MGIIPTNWNFKFGRSGTRPESLRRAWKAGIGILLIACVVTGCDFRRVVVNDPLIAESLERLVPGKSTVQDVVQKLGAPDDIDGKSTGMVFRYRYGDSKLMRLNFGWLFRIVLPIVPSMNLGRGEGVTQVLHIAMKENGVFDHYIIQDPPAPPRFWFWPF